MRPDFQEKGFDLDLAYGVGREDALYHVLREARIEVKSDRKAQATGNVFVEFSYRKRPSGIATTTAEWWAIEVALDRWLLIPTPKLQSLCSRAKAEGKVKHGGDRFQSRGFLIPLAWLTEGEPAGGVDAPRTPSKRRKAA